MTVQEKIQRVLTATADYIKENNIDAKEAADIIENQNEIIKLILSHDN